MTETTATFPVLDRPRTAFGWRAGEWAGVAMLLTALTASPLALYGPDFYYGDNVADTFVPYFIEIGRQVTRGSFPFITLKSWYGGAFAGEYAPGVFNPVVLALSAAFYLLFDNFAYVAASFAVFHLVLLGLGVFAICGALRCRLPEAVFAATVAASGIWLIYWAAMSWSMMQASLAWFVWAVAAAIRLRQRPVWLIPTALLIALTLASGTPQTDLALAIVLGVLLLDTLSRDGWRACSGLLLAALGGAMLAAPCLFSMLGYYGYSLRPASFSFGQWSVPFYAFLSLGSPVFLAPWFTWDKWDVVGLPIVYLDWAVPLILIKAWRDERSVFKDQYVRLFGWLALAFLVICMLPNVTTMRWSFRFLPMLHVFLILMVARLLAVRRTAGITTFGWDFRLIAAAIAPPVVVSALTVILWRPQFEAALDPGRLALMAFCTGLAILVFAAARRWQFDRRLGLLTFGHVVVFFGIVAAFPTNPNTPRYDLPTLRQAPREDVLGDGNTLFLYDWPVRLDRHSGWQNIDPPGRAGWLLTGAAPLLFGGSAINGTSGMGPYSVRQFFGFGDDGWTYRDSLPRLFAIDPSTGASMADLMRIDRIVAEAGKWAEATAQAVPSTWRRSPLGGGRGVLFRSPLAQRLPGTLSYLPRGVTVELLSFSDRREEYAVSVAPDYDGKPLVFARPWFPGYRFRLDGTELGYRLAEDILPEVTLPPGSSGRLAVEYLPTGFPAGCLLAAIGVVALVVAALGRRQAGPLPAAAPADRDTVDRPAAAMGSRRILG